MAIDVLCRYYKTNVLGMIFYSLPAVILNDHASIRAALSVRAFDGKPQLLLAELRDPELKVRGVFFTEGQLWHEQRRYMLRYLRDYGFGRRFEKLELESRNELKMFIDIVKNGPEYPHEHVRFELSITQSQFEAHVGNSSRNSLKRDLYLHQSLFVCHLEICC